MRSPRLVAYLLRVAGFCAIGAALAHTIAQRDVFDSVALALAAITLTAGSVMREWIG